ncbi:hypothetical protein [Aeromicrobium sp. UC242_57]|uniref:hypothetical protein n=1 Tax=Aeromicrobium sp. UC242_57 TaxID=3374624 RepID=UPI0037A738CD
MATPITKNAKKTIDTQMVKIDAKTAQAWLDEFNTHNRNIRAPHVTSLARDMAAGRWTFNGAPIVFAADGTLLDGQHRLAAIAKAKCAIPFLVIRGVSAESQHTMDTGSRRSAADAYSLAGRGNHAGRATAVARFALIIEDKVDNEKVSTAELFEYLDKNPLILKCVESNGARWNGTGMTPRVYDYCTWRLTEIDEADATQFFTSLKELTALPEGSPIMALHKRLLVRSGNGTLRKQARRRGSGVARLPGMERVA